MFIDLENAFDQVPRKVTCFALRQKGAPEYLANGVVSLYRGYKTTASVKENI